MVVKGTNRAFEDKLLITNLQLYNDITFSMKSQVDGEGVNLCMAIERLG